MSSAETSFAARAIAQVKFLTSGGKLGRTNLRLRSLRDRQSHSTPEASGEGSAGPTHGMLLPANAETLCPAQLAAVATSKCSGVALLRDTVSLAADPPVVASEYLLLVRWKSSARAVVSALPQAEARQWQAN